MVGSKPAPPSRRVISTTSPLLGAPRLFERDVGGDAADGIDDAHPALGRADAERDEAAVLAAQQGGVGHRAEPRGVDATQDARPQAQDVGAANKVFGVGEAAHQRQLMLQLRGVGGDPVIAGDEREAHQPGIHRRRRWLRSRANFLDRYVHHLSKTLAERLSRTFYTALRGRQRAYAAHPFSKSVRSPGGADYKAPPDPPFTISRTGP